MLWDKFGRRINYLRISVTDRCNLRCRYCMPEEEIKFISEEEILSNQEIFDFVQIATKLGIDKVRLTGGEPLVRKNILNLVELLSNIREIKDLAMTTNAVLLDEYALHLKKKGLHRLNISLDSMDPERYKEITRCGSLAKALKGIERAIEVGFKKIKINTVVEKSSEEKDAKEVKKFADSLGLDIRFIRKMDLSKGEFWKVQGGEGGNCSRCNRIRLTCNGKIFPCLFSELFYDIRKLGTKKAIFEAVSHKPIDGVTNTQCYFYGMGG